jgi:hypothetical protein
MDDAQGTTKAIDPSLYTKRLSPDGSVAMRLNCNRATGTRSATPGADATSGQLQFGPLAGTRALCPPPSLDERITAQARYVRSYLIKDRRLSLSLMADGANGGGRPELLVHVVGPMACGTGGCPTLAFTPDGADYALVSTIGLTRPPIRGSPRTSNGWRNLVVEIGGSGGRSGHAELVHGQRGYPANPTVPPARRIADLAGSRVAIAGFDSFEATTPLPPG